MTNHDKICCSFKTCGCECHEWEPDCPCGVSFSHYHKPEDGWKNPIAREVEAKPVEPQEATKKCRNCGRTSAVVDLDKVCPFCRGTEVKPQELGSEWLDKEVKYFCKNISEYSYFSAHEVLDHLFRKVREEASQSAYKRGYTVASIEAVKELEAYKSQLKKKLEELECGGDNDAEHCCFGLTHNLLKLL